jgi:hypothetical protein
VRDSCHWPCQNWPHQGSCRNATPPIAGALTVPHSLLIHMRVRALSEAFNPGCPGMHALANEINFVAKAEITHGGTCGGSAGLASGLNRQPEQARGACRAGGDLFSNAPHAEQRARKPYSEPQTLARRRAATTRRVFFNNIRATVQVSRNAHASA